MSEILVKAPVRPIVPFLPVLDTICLLLVAMVLLKRD